MDTKVPISVLLADSQYLTRKGISMLIQDLEGYKISAQIEDLHALNKAIKQYNPDLIILDTSSDYNSLKKTLLHINSKSSLNVLAITNYYDKELIELLIEMNIRGILTKDCNKAEITHAIETVAQGERFYCSKILSLVFESSNNVPLSCQNLSKREMEVLMLVVKGLSTPAIAEKLYLSVHTISSHRKNILKKLNLKSPVELVRFAIENNLMN